MTDPILGTLEVESVHLSRFRCMLTCSSAGSLWRLSFIFIRFWLAVLRRKQNHSLILTRLQKSWRPFLVLSWYPVWAFSILKNFALLYCVVVIFCVLRSSDRSFCSVYHHFACDMMTSYTMTVPLRKSSQIDLLSAESEFFEFF